MSKSNARLIVLQGPTKIKSLRLGEKVTIGRTDDNDLVLANNAVSRNHAEITREHQQCFITDLRSRNGTLVNGEPLKPNQPHRLKHHDRIQIAGDTAILEIDDPLGTLTLDLDISKSLGLVLDVDAREVWIDGKPLEPRLSPEQFKFLALLFRNPEKVFSRDEIAAEVWRDIQNVSNQMIDALASRVRKRLAEQSPGHDYIDTLRGHGFKFAPRK